MWMNLDYLAERYPQARVTGATIAGHYFYATYYDGISFGLFIFKELLIIFCYSVNERTRCEPYSARHNGRFQVLNGMNGRP